MGDRDRMRQRQGESETGMRCKRLAQVGTNFRNSERDMVGLI